MGEGEIVIRIPSKSAEALRELWKRKVKLGMTGKQLSEDAIELEIMNIWEKWKDQVAEMERIREWTAGTPAHQQRASASSMGRPTQASSC